MYTLHIQCQAMYEAVKQGSYLASGYSRNNRIAKVTDI